MKAQAAKFLLPREVHFGPGSLDAAGDIITRLQCSRVFVVTDRTISRLGLLDRLLDHLKSRKLSVTVFDRTEPEPTVQCVHDASESLRQSGKPDLVVSLGGGSVMDVAKCANVVGMNGGSILDYEDGAKNPRMPRVLLPHVAIPTTAGTGSEATVWAVFIDPERRFKTAIQDTRLISDVAILDYELTTTMPPNVTAATGMDALTHAIEAYVSKAANPLTDAYCRQAIQMCASNLRTAVRDGKNPIARANMLLASFMGGAAFSNSSLGIAHTLAEAIGGYHRIPHGVANAILLPHVMEFNLGSRLQRFGDVARFMEAGKKQTNASKLAGLAVDAVSDLCNDIGVPRRLREMGVRREDLQMVAKIAAAWANLSGNPRRISRKQIEHILDKAY